MTKRRTHSVAFERRVVQEHPGDEPLRGPATRQELSRNLIRIRIETYEAARPDEDEATAATTKAYEARFAALERWSGNRRSTWDFRRGLCEADLGRKARLHP